jgi:hypothetical protein
MYFYLQLSTATVGVATQAVSIHVVSTATAVESVDNVSSLVPSAVQAVKIAINPKNKIGFFIVVV